MRINKVCTELLHWSDITKPVVPNQIEDLRLIRPDTKEERIAYRSFYGAKVKDPEWKAAQPPVSALYRTSYILHELTSLRRPKMQIHTSIWSWRSSTATDMANSRGKTLQTCTVCHSVPTSNPRRLDVEIENYEHRSLHKKSGYIKVKTLQARW